MVEPVGTTAPALTVVDAVAAPKALLHDHLDGGLRIATVLELADSIGWALPERDEAALQAWFTRGAATNDLLQYLATFEHTLAVMQTADHVERVAYEATLDLAADGVVYAEVRFAPELHQAGGLALEAVVEAVTAGFRRGERDARSPISMFAILCAMRTEHRALEIAQLVDRLRERDDKVVAFDLAGAETGFPPSLHADALAFARARHLNVTLHASEPPDLELIDDALAQGAHRVGHGVRLQADIEWAGSGADREVVGLGPLAQYVLDRQVHLEMAPTCHVHVGAVESFEQHPIAAFLRAGLNVGVNTDNRLMSDVRPSSELDRVVTTFGLTSAETERLVVNAIESGFAPYATRQQIIRDHVHPWFAAHQGG
ncbi:MAG TPA: adenosine deaminase family protein [Ilumatobacter sp.]|nr:adenosine deaminase family protein [Ilumatobacter sp.]